MPLYSPNGSVITGATDNAALRADGTAGSTMQGSALIIADTTAALSRSGAGGIALQGTNTNDSASAGDIGEFVTSAVASGSAVALTSATAKTVTSISLTAGDWEAFGNVAFTASGATSSLFAGGINTVADTMPGFERNGVYVTTFVATALALYASATGPVRFSINATTTVYLIARADYSGGTVGGYGTISARRRR